VHAASQHDGAQGAEQPPGPGDEHQLHHQGQQQAGASKTELKEEGAEAKAANCTAQNGQPASPMDAA
jgi:hypothetical protein